MRRFFFSFETTVVSARVAVSSWEKVRAMSKKGFTITDILSAMIELANEEQVVKMLEERKSKIDALPKSMQGVLRDTQLSDAQKEAMLKAIDG